MKFTKEKKAQLVSLMQEYNVSDIGDLMDILPDLDLEDELPQQEVDLAENCLTYKEPVVLGDVTYPFN